MNGILPLWKPAGLTSHDCVFKVRKILKMKKVGHTGTLDPDVTGVLPICLGRATKIAEYITDAGKAYHAKVTIGYSTTTEDASGETVETKKVEQPITAETIEHALTNFVGEIEQTPPMYSAVKVNGKRLYEYARQGIEVERPTRIVRIDHISLVHDSVTFTADTVSFEIDVACGKGTYIRTLAVMIGEALGYPAHMSSLIRTASGNFTEENCVTFDTLQRLVEEEKLDSAIFSIETGLNSLPQIEISDTLAVKVSNGARLEKHSLSFWKDTVHEMVFLYQNKAIAIYETHPTKPDLVKPKKILAID